MKYLFVLSPLCALLFSTACSQSPEKLIAAANRYHERKKFNEASILYQKAISKDKTNAEAYYREGINLLDSGNPVEAAKFLRRAVDLSPNNADAETKLSEIYLMAYASDTRKFKTLLPEIAELDNKILERHPDSFDGLRLKALLSLANNDRDKALETFQRANQVKPHSPNLVGWYADALVAAQRAPEAETLVRDMLAHDPKWSPGYDFLFMMYSRQNAKPKAEAVLRERLEKNPKDAVAIQNLANYLVADKRYSEAEATIKHVMDDPKTFPNGRELLGDFYYRAGKFDQALQQYQAGLKDDPKDEMQYQQRVVSIYQTTGRHNDAMQLAKSLAEKNPKNDTAAEMYAALLLRNASQNEIAKAASELKALSQSNPQNATLHLDLARAYFSASETDKSLNEATAAMQEEGKKKNPRPILMNAARVIIARIDEDRGQHAKALEQTNNILNSQPNNTDARLIRARALVGTNELDKAQAELEALTREFPQFNDARIQLANLYLLQRQYDRASAEFDKIQKINPSDTRAFVGMQTVKLAQGKTSEAIQALADLVQKNPQNGAYRYQLAGFQSTGAAQLAKSDPARAKQLVQEAADNYKEILKTNNNSADVWMRLGVLQRDLGQNDAALASFDHASNADPTNVNAALSKALLLEQVLRKKKDAENVYTKVLGIDPENPVALNNLAFLTAEEGGNLDQAMTWAERAKKRAPNSPSISDTLGFVYYRKNLNAQALQIFQQVVQEAPQDATFRLHLAMALQKKGDKEGARDEAQKALKTPLRPGEEDKIRSFLNQLS